MKKKILVLSLLVLTSCGTKEIEPQTPLTAELTNQTTPSNNSHQTTEPTVVEDETVNEEKGTSQLSPDILNALNDISSSTDNTDALLKILQERTKENLALLEKQIEEEKKAREAEEVATVIKTDGTQQVPNQQVVNETINNTDNGSTTEVKISHDGKYVKELTVEATAYDAFCDTGCIGITKTGIDVRNRTPKIIAVDPNVIPLHSIVEIIVNGKSMGLYQAEDTGGDIKGNRIDILYDTRENAYKFGRRDVKVRILNVSAEDKMKAYQALLGTK